MGPDVSFFSVPACLTHLQIITFRNCMLAFYRGPLLHLRIYQSDSTTAVAKVFTRWLAISAICSLVRSYM